MSGNYKATVLITGATTGLGYEAAIALAKKLSDHQIIIASRSNKDDAASSINKATSQRNTIYLPLDLGSPDSIKAFASNVTKSYPKITHLLLNAGLQFLKIGTQTYYNQEVEKTFAVNHLGHSHLFYLLLPHLADDAHIVVTASGVHDPAQKTMMPNAVYNTAEEVAHPGPEKLNTNGQQGYSDSKLCNVLWTYALDRHSKASGRQFFANSFDPGLMFGTGLAREAPAPLLWIWYHVLPMLIPLFRLIMTPNIHTPAESGAALARLALGEQQGVRGVTGKYYEGLKEIPSSVDSYVEAKQENLWEWTLKFLAQGDEGLKKRWETLQG